MLDLKYIVSHPDLVKAGAAKKHIVCDVDQIVALDEERRDLISTVDAARSASKAAGKQIAAASADDRPSLVAAQAAHKATLKAMEARQKSVDESLEALLLLVPNVPAAEVPAVEAPAAEEHP